MSAACMTLKATGPEIRARPLQYSESPQLELDSLVVLTNAINLRVSGISPCTDKGVCCRRGNVCFVVKNYCS